LVGPSGSGKTTIANLLPRFWDIDAGRLLIDGMPLNQVKLKSLREQISIVSQETFLFNDSIAANIAYGSPNASVEAIEAAAKAAHAAHFIKELPEGYETIVGERGVMLSGGQRQRIAIARALLKDSPLLILDEATSALDIESEQHVQAALEALMKGRTTLVIAHRLSTIRNASKIAVVSAGRVVEEGTHMDLLPAGGEYARLYEMQFGVAQSSQSAQEGITQ